VWLDARRRMRRKVERLQRQQAVERERIRIAGTFTMTWREPDAHHDVERIGPSDLDSPQLVAGHLDQIHNTARELTRAMSEVVWAVNPGMIPSTVWPPIWRSSAKFAQNCRHPVQNGHAITVPARVITAEVRHNLFLAFKEALHNAIKHSGASEVRISLAVKPAAFILTVEDNGNKFASETLSAEHHTVSPRSGNGLANMRQRLAEIGGRCELRARREKERR